jgi:hypothetical protein
MFINDMSLVNKSTNFYDGYQQYVWLPNKNYVWAARELSYGIMEKGMEFDEKDFWKITRQR